MLEGKAGNVGALAGMFGGDAEDGAVLSLTGADVLRESVGVVSIVCLLLTSWRLKADDEEGCSRDSFLVEL